MTTTHAPISWIAGDDCEIRATLLDQDGNPFDLSAATIMWALSDVSGHRVIDTADVTIEITDAVAGQCSILVPATKTSPLLSGRYSDALRIVIDGITSTLSVGVVNVAADPWASAAVVAKSEARPALRRVS